MDDFDFAGGSESAEPIEAEAGAGDMGFAAPAPAASVSPVVSQTHVDSSAATAFKAKNAQVIAKREAEQAVKKKEMTQSAEAYLEKFKQERAKRLAATSAKNREAQSKHTAGGPYAIKNLVDLEKTTSDREKMRTLLKAL